MEILLTPEENETVINRFDDVVSSADAAGYRSITLVSTIRDNEELLSMLRERKVKQLKIAGNPVFIIKELLIELKKDE